VDNKKAWPASERCSVEHAVDEAKEQLEANETDDVPLKAMAGPCGEQVGHGIGRLADDLELLANCASPWSKIVLVGHLGPQQLYVRLIRQFDAPSEPLLDQECLADLL